MKKIYYNSFIHNQAIGHRLIINLMQGRSESNRTNWSYTTKVQKK